MKMVEYHGIRTTDPGGTEGLRNPERGWRIETLFAEATGAGVWGPAHHLRGKVSPNYSEDWWILDAERYGSHGLTLAQTYCYLDSFADKPISEQKLEHLQLSLNNLRKRGLKALLRFAYEKDMNQRSGPTLDIMLQHLDQLDPIIRANTDVIFVLQAGFVGAWGEWHSSTHGLEQDHAGLATFMEKFLVVLPANRMTQVRVPKYKRWVLDDSPISEYEILDTQNAHTGSPKARIGFHNDGFLAGPTDGGTWPEAPHYGSPGNPEFDMMTLESPYVPVDGELFWADQAGKVDGLAAAIQMRLHHYTSFSLAHSFSEREGKPFSIDDWLHTPLSEEQVREARLPISGGYFQNTLGESVERTCFEYIRDHLGYRLELQHASIPEEAHVGETLAVQVELINRGFSTLHNPRPVFLALISEAGAVTEFPVPDADPRKWQPHQPGDPEFLPLTHRVDVRVHLPGDIEAGWYQVGLWLPDVAESIRLDARYAVRVANRDVPWWVNGEGKYGVNVLGIVQVIVGE